MAKFKIIQKREKCIRCGACIAACPENWEKAGDYRAKPKKTEISEEEYECNKKAADVCPVKIEKIEE